MWRKHADATSIASNVSLTFSGQAASCQKMKALVLAPVGNSEMSRILISTLLVVGQKWIEMHSSLLISVLFVKLSVHKCMHLITNIQIHPNVGRAENSENGAATNP